MTWRDRLRQYAEERFGALGKFSEAFGIDSQALSYYLNGHRMPKADFFQRLRDGGLSVDWLFSGDGSPEADTNGPGNADAQLLREIATDLEALHHKWTERANNVENLSTDSE